MSAQLFIGAVIILLLVIGICIKNTNRICKSKKRLDGKTALVTGGTAGMGLEMAKDLAERGARVIVACPYPDEGASAVQEITRCSKNHQVLFKLLDLASLESTRNFAAEILNTEDRLDILINNAGVGGPTTAPTRDGLDFIMQVNYYGAFLLTILLLPLLKKTGRPGEPSRIVNVSSMLHWIGSTAKSSPFILTSYANSKLCMVLFSRELTKSLKDSRVVINNSDPGAVGTQIFHTVFRFRAIQFLGWVATVVFYILSKTPWQGAQTALYVALDEEAGEVSGEYFTNCKPTRAIARAYDDKLMTKLWEESIGLVKLTDKELDRCLKSA